MIYKRKGRIHRYEVNTQNVHQILSRFSLNGIGIGRNTAIYSWISVPETAGDILQR